jgi:hypothetical protein
MNGVAGRIAVFRCCFNERGRGRAVSFPFLPFYYIMAKWNNQRRLNAPHMLFTTPAVFLRQPIDFSISKADNKNEH